MVHDTLLPWCSYLDWEPEPVDRHASPTCSTSARASRAGCRRRRRTCSSSCGRCTPTPAVGGHPGAEALALIAAVEGVDRGRYGGAVGWVDAAGNGTWAVAIRCAELSDDRTRRPPRRRRRHRRRQRPAGRARRDPGQVPGDAVGARPPLARASPRRSTAACTATFAARSVATRVTCGPRRPTRAISSAGVATVVGVEAVGGGEGHDVGAVRRAEQLLEARRSRAVACGRNEKMPPPSLSTTTIRRSTPRRRRAVSASGVVDEGDVADQHDDGPPPTGRGRAPSTRRRRCRWRRGWRGPGRVGPPNHSRSRTGIDEATTSSASAGSTRGDVRATAGSVSAGCCAKHPLDVRLGARRRHRPSRRATSSSPGRAARCGRRARRREAATLPSGSIDARSTDLHDRRAAGDDPLASTFDAGGRPTRTTTSGRCVGGEGGVAQHRVERRDGAGDRSTPRRRVGEHRPPGPGGERGDGVGGDAAAPAGDDHAAPAAASAAAPASSAADAGRGAASRVGRARPPPPEGAARPRRAAARGTAG